MAHELKESTRRYDVDWLRVIAVCVLITIHTASMFDPYPITAVKGATLFPLIVYSTFVHEWRLAILFIVSGASSYFALGFLSARQFVSVRVRRILVPLLMGTLLIVPIHLYYWQFYRNPTYDKSYFQFYQTIIVGLFRDGNFGRSKESIHWAHLWFLAYLFVSSLVALPLFLYLKRNGRHLISRLAALMEKRGAIFLLALPLAVIEAALRARWVGRALIIVDDWASFCSYLALFIYGFVIFSDGRIKVAIERHRWAALALGTLTSATYLLMTFTRSAPVRGYNLNWTLFTVLRSFNVWFWCVTVFGFGSRHLNFKSRVLPYANEAVYPVYVIHLPVATIIAYRVVGWPLPPFAQFLIITLATLSVSVLIYEFFIRRMKVTRFLFGLKLKKSERPAAASARNPDAPTLAEVAPPAPTQGQSAD